jgi:hypothetical protein
MRSTKARPGETGSRNAYIAALGILAMLLKRLRIYFKGRRACRHVQELNAYIGDLEAACDSMRKNDQRYRWLRKRNLETVHQGGVFVGLTPHNLVLNGEDMDKAVDAAMRKENKNVYT